MQEIQYSLAEIRRDDYLLTAKNAEIFHRKFVSDVEIRSEIFGDCLPSRPFGGQEFSDLCE